jgi:hypothetical protein
MKRCLVLAGVFVCSLGCDGGGSIKDGGVVGSGSFTSRATLTGDQMGLDLDLPSRLSKTIPVVMNGPQLTGTVAYLGRLSATGDSAAMVVPVTNVGDHWQCFIEASTFDLLDQNGVSLGLSVITTYVRGSVGRSSPDGGNGLHTDTCLEPGGTGYLFNWISDKVYALLGSLHLELTVGDKTYLAPAVSVVPVSYQISAPDQRYTVTVTNNGPLTATVWGGYAVLLNDADVPVFQAGLDAYGGPTPGYYDLAPGATGQLTSDELVTLWTGKSTKQIVLLDIDPALHQ